MNFTDGRRDSLGRMAIAVLTAISVISCSTERNRTDGKRLSLRASTDQPNIVLILADDIGAESFTSYGGESFSTPTLDRLASQGIQFDNAFSQPLCSPSRVSILTGQYPYRSGVTTNKGGGNRFTYLHEFRHDPWGLDENGVPFVRTFAHVLKDAGYKTAVAGKWGLAQFDYNPDHVAQMGFDRFAVHARIYEEIFRDRYWIPSLYVDSEFLPDVEDTFAPDFYTDYLIEFMSNNRDRPFLAYYPMALMHFYLQDPESNPIASGEGSYKTGENFLGDFSRPFYDPALYGKNMTYMDSLIGRLVAAAEEFGIAENTIFIFLGDNGSIPGAVDTVYKGRNVIGAKGSTNDAGTRVPFIAYWPGTIAGGQVATELTDLTDILPTLAELAGAEIPNDRPIDGLSLSRRLKGGGHFLSRDWVFAQDKDRVRIRGRRFALHQDGRLMDLGDNRYSPVQAEDSIEAQVESKRLAAIMDQLAPEAIEIYRRSPNYILEGPQH